MRRFPGWRVWALTAVWLAAGAAGAQAVPAAGLRLTTAKPARSLEVPVWEDAEGVRFSLRTAAEFFGGGASWSASSQKLVLLGPQGRKAVIAPGYPKSVIDGQSLIRLPAAPAFRLSQVAVTPETFQLLWRSVGGAAPEYDPALRTLSVGPVPPAEAAPAPSPAPAAAALPEPAAAPVAPAPAAHSQACVVIDAGHGGKDPGAIGPSRLEEKTVVLEIALQLASLLEKDLGCRVILTRRDDQFIPLPERPEVANRAKANLFVSIHANASHDRKAVGSQVFIYNREASSRKAAETARLENRDANYLEIIKDDLRQSVHEKDSITAAGLVSQALEKEGLDARRIERAPFYVLAKSHMPSILVETAFISNPGEEGRLRRREFCRRLAEVIYGGIKQYARETKI